MRSDNVFTLDGDTAMRVVEAPRWGAAFADALDEHVAQHGVPQQISFFATWQSDPDGSTFEQHRRPAKLVLQSVPRYDDDLGRWTNIHRLGWWDPEDKALDDLFQTVIDGRAGRTDQLWARIPGSAKYEAAFVHIIPERHPTSDLRFSDMSDRHRRSVENAQANQQVLDLDRGNQLDGRAISQALRNSNLGGRPNRLGLNVGELITAMESTLLGPVLTYPRGIAFFSLDEDRRPVVDENLTTTYVRGYHLVQLGTDAYRWWTGTWHGDADSDGNEFGSQARFNRIADEDTTKPVPIDAPMTFWTTNTPDAARIEVGLHARSRQFGPHHVRVFQPENPNLIEAQWPAPSAADAAAIVRTLLTDRYGADEHWPEYLTREARILDGILRSHGAMTMSATSLADRFRRYGVATITSVRRAADAARREDEAHPIRALFKRR
ncbi:hypothetical protein [Curtobacterium sp. MCSS17_016]|uniref:hypothetical protein n=1 Tax=Curtobacterium sp. MCSS17_016 TaxID=2175644 RepID=UPI000DA93133|nr:hypothetical protein [Curtobacterium sp. MCSS17_016]WIE81360.1 hypothetical protein DEJ19_019185 [Curtobacterium sp. MCSS17_016]